MATRRSWHLFRAPNPDRSGSSPAPVSVRELSPAEFIAWLDQLIAVYAAAMRPPAELLAGRRSIMAGHAGHPGFRALAARRGDAAAAAWLDDSFEVAELHVAPDYQGGGIGAGVLLRLASGRRERTALLSTRDADTPARRLYHGTGFTDLLTAFRFFPGAEPPYAVMGAELPLRARSPRSSR